MNQCPSRATRMLPAPFSTTCAFRLARERARRLHAVGLHVGGAQREQARGFGRVRGEQRVGLAPCAGVAQVGIFRDQVERVGVEHAGQVARERRAEQRLGALALARGRGRRPARRGPGRARRRDGAASARACPGRSEMSVLEQADVDACPRPSSAPRARRAARRRSCRRRRRGSRASRPCPCGSCAAAA